MQKKYLSPICEVTLFTDVKDVLDISANVDTTGGIIGGDNWVDFGDLWGGKK